MLSAVTLRLVWAVQHSEPTGIEQEEEANEEQQQRQQQEGQRDVLPRPGLTWTCPSESYPLFSVWTRWPTRTPPRWKTEATLEPVQWNVSGISFAYVYANHGGECQ